MNLLAHLLLSGPDPEVRLGNVFGDLVKGPLEDRTDLPAGIIEGVRLHRAIDHFTDHHDLPHRSTALISPEWRRFSGVLVDVFYDFVLSRHWDEFCLVPRRDYLDAAYAQFAAYKGELPEHFRWVANRMIADDWLGCYGTEKGVALTLGRMSHRLRRYVPLADAAEELPAIFPALERHFLEFWPQLAAEAAAQRGG